MLGILTTREKEVIFICSQCGDLTEWDFKLGIEPLCSNCWDKKCDTSSQIASIRRKNRLHKKNRNRVYYHNNKEKVKARQRIYRSEHFEELKIKKQNYINETPEKEKSRHQIYYQKHKYEIQVKHREWRLRKKEKS
jgi:hypothetical protein